jgi:manganese-dependent ADP-ribose/CDP-alcohol diphosphatase
MDLSRRSFLGAAAAGLGRADPQFSFGVLADVQYADQDTVNGREYRRSRDKLRSASEWFARERLEFVIQLGDLVDKGVDNLDRVLAGWESLAPKRHVIGNHDAEIDRATLLGRLKLERGYYQFAAPGWHFLVLDGSQSGPEGARMLEELRARKEPNAQTWNGAIAGAQKEWLRKVLKEASAKGQRAIVFCHFPVLPESCRREHLLWNWREVLEILEAAPSVAAWINGHDHRGGYGVRAGIQYVTVPGVVENDIRDCARVVDVFPGRLVIRSQNGTQRLELRGE